MESKKNEALVGVRLPQDEVEKLDRLTQGRLSRSQIVRLLVEDFLDKPEKEQRDFLVKRLFGE